MNLTVFLSLLPFLIVLWLLMLRDMRKLGRQVKDATVSREDLNNE